MEATVDAKERAGELATLISKATEGQLRLLKSAASVLLHALGGEDVVVVVADKQALEWDGHHLMKGNIVLFTARHVGFVTFNGTAVGNSPFGMPDDEPTLVEVLPRHAVRSVTLECPAIPRQGVAAEFFEFDELPWGTTLRVQYAGRSEPLIVRDDISNMPVLEVQRLLLEDLAAGR